MAAHACSLSNAMLALRLVAFGASHKQNICAHAVFLHTIIFSRTDVSAHQTNKEVNMKNKSKKRLRVFTAQLIVSLLLLGALSLMKIYIPSGAAQLAAAVKYNANPEYISENIKNFILKYTPQR